LVKAMACFVLKAMCTPPAGACSSIPLRKVFSSTSWLVTNAICAGGKPSRNAINPLRSKASAPAFIVTAT